MTFISYAQNFEDVMLWRALKHVEGGFYLDVGAWSPDTDSVTKAFYERGWRGVNVEPNPHWHARLNEQRPQDTNLAVALSDAPGEETLYFFSEHGLATMDAAIAQQHIAQNWEAQPGRVPVTTLATLWDEHVGDREVHFLKVDVEGWEEHVLRGNDWRRHRPWIVVVESTRPLSQVESHQGWEPMLLEAGYQLAYMDGLNRYYVAGEHAELLPALRYPPNYFDHFVLVNQHWAETQAHAAEARSTEADARAAEASARAQAAEAQAAQAVAWVEAAEVRAAEASARAQAAEARVVEAEARAQVAEARAAQAEAQLDGVYHSRSWRWTRPLRDLNRIVSPKQGLEA